MATSCLGAICHYWVMDVGYSRERIAKDFRIPVSRLDACIREYTSLSEVEQEASREFFREDNTPFEDEVICGLLHEPRIREVRQVYF